jgi:hypothetical protein
VANASDPRNDGVDVRPRCLDKATSAKLTQATTEAGFPSKVISTP